MVQFIYYYFYIMFNLNKKVTTSLKVEEMKDLNPSAKIYIYDAFTSSWYIFLDEILLSSWEINNYSYGTIWGSYYLINDLSAYTLMDHYRANIALANNDMETFHDLAKEGITCLFFKSMTDMIDLVNTLMHVWETEKNELYFNNMDYSILLNNLSNIDSGTADNIGWLYINNHATVEEFNAELDKWHIIPKEAENIRVFLLAAEYDINYYYYINGNNEAWDTSTPSEVLKIEENLKEVLKNYIIRL